MVETEIDHIEQSISSNRGCNSFIKPVQSETVFLDYGFSDAPSTRQFFSNRSISLQCYFDYFEGIR